MNKLDDPISVEFCIVWSKFKNLFLYEPPHDKTNKMACAPSEDSESSLSAWRKPGSLATHLAHSEDSDQTGRMPRLIWVFDGRTVILLVLSCCSSFNELHVPNTEMLWQTQLHMQTVYQIWDRLKQFLGKCSTPSNGHVRWRLQVTNKNLLSLI